MSNGHDIDALNKKINRMQRDWRKLADRADSLEELIRIIRKKGWTTPAEYRLVFGLVDGMTTHLQALNKFQDTLLEGSELVDVRG